MSSITLNKTYPLAALMIHATNQDVTVERLQAVFKILNVEFSSKIASMFCLSAEKYQGMLQFSSSDSNSASANTSSNAAPSAQAKQEEVVEESSSGCLDF